MYNQALIITNLLYIFASNKKWIVAQILNLLDLLETDSNWRIIQEIRERSSKQFRLKKAPEKSGQIYKKIIKQEIMGKYLGKREILRIMRKGEMK